MLDLSLFFLKFITRLDLSGGKKGQSPYKLKICNLIYKFKTNNFCMYQ